MQKIYSVEEYLELHPEWKEGLTSLRKILSKTELLETVKWSIPTYTINNKNVAGIGAFKDYFGLWFFNGVFLKDPEKVLINAQEGKTKGLRQWRFKSVDDLNEPLILNYVNEAIDNQKQGLEVKPNRKKKDVIIPNLLLNKLEQNTALKSSFEALTPFKQREYCEYIENAKREATKQSRLDKITPMILQGIGLNDKYRNC